ncbi:MAG TPA: chemotaxis response regulator protein-glutamate methylesterase [Acidiferrobacterales bacterium]|nr:chemotaxis response regulator protein-glutamate methylesterase [Acidiferrobacterales bacterium]
MGVRVLIVDDSGFFRRRLTEVFAADPGIEVVGTAANGQEAVDQVPRLKPDVITMDIEMPIMDGITAVRRIMASHPTPILMFSSLTTEGATATFEALEAGAADYLPKRLEDIAADRNVAIRELTARVRLLAVRRVRPVPRPQAEALARELVRAPAARSGSPGRYRVLVIGASTGGPVALQQVLMALPKDFPLPILLIQHMPGSFTGPFAQRLNQMCKITVKEAADWDVLVPGQALLAPGGKQMLLEQRAGQVLVRIQEPEPGQNYKPCVDVTFSAVAHVFPGKTLALVLTGMGSDGREGARLLKQGGSTVWAQDEKSCVVYGMPAAVAEAGLADQVLSLQSIGPDIAQEVGAWIS